MVADELFAQKSAMSINIDKDTKEKAEQMLSDMGMNMTTYIAASLKALVREKRIPFSMVTKEYHTEQVILSKLAEAEREAVSYVAAPPIDASEVIEQVSEQNGYKV